MIQVTIKSLIIRGLHTTILFYLRDYRLTYFQDFLIGMVETNLHEEPIFFNCITNLTIKLKDKNILKAIELDVKFHGFSIIPCCYLVAIIYKICYKTTNNLDHIKQSIEEL